MNDIISLFRMLYVLQPVIDSYRNELHHDWEEMVVIVHYLFEKKRLLRVEGWWRGKKETFSLNNYIFLF